MAPIDPWRNSTPIFGAVAFCMTNIDDYRTSLTSTSLTKSWTYSLQKRSLRWTSSEGLNVGTVPTFKMHNVGTVPKFKMHNAETVPTNKMHDIGTELSYATLRTKTQKWKWPLMEDNLWLKTTFNRRRPSMEDDLWQKTTFDGRRPLMEDDLCRKTTFDRLYRVLPEKNVYDSSPWQSQHNWAQTGNPISGLNRK